MPKETVMPYVLPHTEYPCLGTAEAEAFAAHLTEKEELRDVTTAGHIVTVPGMDLRAAMDLATLGLEHGFMSDPTAAGVIRAIEADPDKRWVDGPPTDNL
jgi:hypothetical protein